MQFKLNQAIAAALLAFASSQSYALESVNKSLLQSIDKKLEAIQPDIIALRQDIHQHPELGNREVRTSKLVAERLSKLGLDVKSGIGVTGVVAVLKGGKPGPVIALRSELDALPVEEKTGLPYASKERSEYNGENVGVMHACGHDAHIAILLGVAEALAANRANLAGTVKFIFQPAEEGPPDGEEGGAALMIKEGVLDNPRPGAIFMLHVGSGPSGSLRVTKGPTSASADHFVSRIVGVQAHGAAPWRGIDPVPIAAEVILALQQIPSRQTDLIENRPPVISIGRVDGGSRHNIIPESISLDGTVRAKSNSQRDDVLKRIARITEHVAAAHGAKGEFILDSHHWPAGYNEPVFVDKISPLLEQTAKISGTDFKVSTTSGYTGEDFWEYAKIVPALAFGLGVTPPSIPLDKAAGNHSPYFQVDDQALIVGQKAFVRIVLDYFAKGGYDLPPPQQH
ncbi:amidohydrolase [Methylobacillus flagellatus]|uniref:amidohydrolase n=1 Tax=Methylobacillus flagellatus TaxID=405 RepID=UPI0028541431|nr:amidohydrolase [Methylobacillus flagellatus]MDR5170521.1 amidohydrolase [Methylobacillus flagellatus]